MTTVAETIAGMLYAAGIRTVFGLPGGETVELLDEFRKLGIDFVLVRNESSAAFMADAHARVTGRPAVCMTTLGPGAANVVMGVAHCYLDRSPVIVITAQKPESMMAGYTHQVLDLHALFRPISKASERIHSGNVEQAVLGALRMVEEGRPGPVHLQLSTADAAAPVHDAADEGSAAPYGVRSDPPLEPQDLERAQQLVRRSSRPLIVAGLGLEPQRPYEAVRSFAESIQAPVITTPKAKGAMPDRHPLFAGVIGLTRSDPVYELVDDADCIVALGFDVVELVKPWEHRGSLIWIAPWENYDPTIPADCELVGDMAAALSALTGERRPRPDDWGEKRVAAFRRAHMSPEPPAGPGRISPQAALRVMRACARSDAFLAVDVGSHKIFSSLEWPCPAPNRFLVSNGLSSMGFALPAAIGTSIAAPDTEVLCLTGDAGLAMNMGELGVLAEREIPVVVVVFNDGAIDLIRSHQQRAGKAVFGTEFAPPRQAEIAAAFGLASHVVGDEETFAGVLRDCLAARSPALIEVMLDPSGYPTTPKAIKAG